MNLTARLLTSAAALVLSTGIAAAATVVASADLNVRSGPGTQYSVVGVIPAGGAADVRDCTGAWCRVDYRGQAGWASSAYLSGATVAALPNAYYGNAYSEPYYDDYAQPYDEYSYYDYYGPYSAGIGPGFTFGGGYHGGHHFRHAYGPHFSGHHPHFATGPFQNPGHGGPPPHNHIANNFGPQGGPTPHIGGGGPHLSGPHGGPHRHR